MNSATHIGARTVADGHDDTASSRFLFVAKTPTLRRRLIALDAIRRSDISRPAERRPRYRPAATGQVAQAAE
ncbi:hypothetical protein [Haloarchaeobius sp. DFWS5]|uniref:hypothetical protein n=1 Tax=Haloarchaeobius sp. DFWS5 TaxID=3446114 RepID=UPI003EB7E705